MRIARILAGLALAAPLAMLAATPAPEVCATRYALLEKRLEALQQRLQSLEHDLASKPLAAATREPWRDLARWRELRNGMSQAEVARILGAPGHVTSYYGFQRWEYPDALGARVNFDERGALIAWGSLAR